MNKKQLSQLMTVLCLCLGINTWGQVERPVLRDYDRVERIERSGKCYAKQYYQGDRLVMYTSYVPLTSHLGIPFAFLPKQGEDSCLVIVEEPQLAYQIYGFGKAKIRYEQYSESGGPYFKASLDKDYQLLQGGPASVQKDMYIQLYQLQPKVRIGEWTLQPTAKMPYKKVDYDRYLIDGEKVKFEGGSALIGDLKAVADEQLINTFGKAFFKKYIRWDMADSKVDTRSNLSGNGSTRFPSSYGENIIAKLEKPISYADFSYFLQLGEERFQVIGIRVNKNKEIIGKSGRRIITKGLDSNAKDRFHPSVDDWQATAKAAGFTFPSPEFNVRFEWKSNKDDTLDGQLYFVIEESTHVESTRMSFKRFLKQLFINPWTGEQEWKECVVGEESIDDGW